MSDFMLVPSYLITDKEIPLIADLKKLGAGFITLDKPLYIGQINDIFIVTNDRYTVGVALLFNSDDIPNLSPEFRSIISLQNSYQLAVTAETLVLKHRSIN